MKSCLYIFALVLCIIGCATNNSTKSHSNSYTQQHSDTLRIANDSLQYEVIILEPSFNSWLLTQRPRGYYGERFLEMRNQRYVTEYNQRVGLPQQFNPDIYLQRINYQRNIRYGYEVNYLLFNYFLFLEQRYNQRFLPTRG